MANWAVFTYEDALEIVKDRAKSLEEFDYKLELLEDGDLVIAKLYRWEPSYGDSWELVPVWELHIPRERLIYLREVIYHILELERDKRAG